MRRGYWVFVVVLFAAPVHADWLLYTHAINGQVSLQQGLSAEECEIGRRMALRIPLPNEEKANDEAYTHCLQTLQGPPQPHMPVEVHTSEEGVVMSEDISADSMYRTCEIEFGYAMGRSHILHDEDIVDARCYELAEHPTQKKN